MIEIEWIHDNLYRVGKEWVARPGGSATKWKHLTPHGALQYDTFAEAVGKAVEGQLEGM